MKELKDNKVITINRKARHEYSVLESYECGIVLLGSEVKALREGKGNLTDSYAKIEAGEVWLINSHISEYKQANIFNHEPERKRKLLLNSSEIRKLQKKTNDVGITLVPLKLYFNKGKIKCELAIAKGKKTFDKRHDIAEREVKREIQRKIKI